MMIDKTIFPILSERTASKWGIIFMMYHHKILMDKATTKSLLFGVLSTHL